ncbi:hypothetical protein BGZ94_009794 [Podila epigama]|nr:hypothetical protein BGZ94_009794 [Podila epigama]
MNPIPFPQTEINIEALENVKTRLFQLQESILFFLRSINPENAPPAVSWTELHSKFNVLIAKYVHLTNLLNGPHNNLLQSYTVFPHETPANDQQVQNLSVLLRTKLTPELEQEDEDRTKEGNLPGLVASPNAGTADERRTLAALKLKISMHDALCQAADDIFENQRDLVHPKARYESDEEDHSKTAGSAPSQRKDITATTTDEQEALRILDSIEGSQVRYLDDWAGSVIDYPGYESEDDSWAGQENDEADYDAHMEIQELQRDSDYYESSDSESEDMSTNVPETPVTPSEQTQAEQHDVKDANADDDEEEDDEGDDDAFMEVSTDSPGFSSTPGVAIPSSDIVMESFDGADDGFEEGFQEGSEELNIE